jgi:protein-S-isoprenylcysteine O-methyltransferase Ste14
MKHKIVSIPPVYLFVCIVATVLLRVLVPGMNWIEFPFTLAGAAFLCAGAYWIACARLSLARHSTPVNFAPSTCVIEEGVYNYSRNPMYVGFVIFLTGCSILSGNILSFLCPAFFFGVLNWMFIPYEEEKMEIAFGEKYLEYKKRVRRWF